jgi:hypothetical protein
VKILFRSILGFVLILVAPATAWAGTAGEVAAAVGGSVAARGPNGRIRVLERGARVSTGEALSTGKGFAVLRLGDGTLVSMRPDTTLTVETFAYGRGSASARLRLRTGGVRLLTGKITERNPTGLVLVTPEGTLHPRGTEFEARVCGTIDCAEERKQIKKGPSGEKSRVAARVINLRGNATAIKLITDRKRTLALGGSLQEQDQVTTAKRSTLSFRLWQGARTTLGQHSSILILRPGPKDGAAPDTGADLLVRKGEVRILRELEEKRTLEVATSLGNIKLSGKGADLLCTGTCASESPEVSWLVPHFPLYTVARGLLDLLVPPAYGRSAPAGLMVRPWSGGEVVLTARGGGSIRVASGRVAWLSGPNAVPVELPQVPAAMSFVGVPRPDLPESTDPRMRGQELSGGIRQDSPEPGVYTRVISGDVTSRGEDDSRLDLGPGERAFSRRGSGRAVRLEQAPPFLATPAPRYLMQYSSRLTLPGLGDDAESRDLLFQHCLVE